MTVTWPWDYWPVVKSCHHTCGLFWAREVDSLGSHKQELTISALFWNGLWRKLGHRMCRVGRIVNQKRLPELDLWTSFSPIQTLSQVCFSTFCDMKQGVLQTSGLLGFPPQITFSYALSERDIRKATRSKDQKEILPYANSSNVSVPCISEWQDTLSVAYPFLMDPRSLRLSFTSCHLSPAQLSTSPCLPFLQILPCCPRWTHGDHILYFPSCRLVHPTLLVFSISLSLVIVPYVKTFLLKYLMCGVY